MVQEPFAEPLVNSFPARLVVIVSKIKADIAEFVAGIKS